MFYIYVYIEASKQVFRPTRKWGEKWEKNKMESLLRVIKVGLAIHYNNSNDVVIEIGHLVYGRLD